MTVYIEYVLIDNFLIDYLLIKATFSTTGVTVRRGRLFLCALLGAGIALIYPLFSNYYLLQTVFKILSGLLIVALSANFKTAKSFIINALVFFSYTFITGGAIIGVYNLLGLTYDNEFTVAIIVIPVYLLISVFEKVVKHLYRRKDTACFNIKIEIALNKNKITLNGFYDTGNGVYDGDSPVIFCGKEIFKKLIGDNFLRVKLKKIFIRTVSGFTENFAVKLDQLMIYNSDEPNIYNNVTLCAVSKSVGEGYDVILHPALMENGYENEFDCKNKKIS